MHDGVALGNRKIRRNSDNSEGNGMTPRCVSAICFALANSTDMTASGEIRLRLPLKMTSTTVLAGLNSAAD